MQRSPVRWSASGVNINMRLYTYIHTNIHIQYLYVSILKVARAAMFADCRDTSSDQCAKNAESVRCGISALTISVVSHFSMVNSCESAGKSRVAWKLISANICTGV